MPNQGHAFSLEFRTRFHPDHLRDLARSGLSETTIAELAIHTVSPDQITKHLGFNDPRITSLLCFPYPGIPSFCRDKIFPPLQHANGHTIRYLQRKGSGLHAYIPPLAQPALTTPGHLILVTEGEKKAAKACQEGYATIGIGGVWNWGRQGELLADLREITWTERPVLLVPDSDVWERDDLLFAFYACGRALERHGAAVSMLRLPQDGEAKVGLDDFLTQQGPTALDTLDRLPLTPPHFEKVARWEQRWYLKKGVVTIMDSTASADPHHSHQKPSSPELPRFPAEAWTSPFQLWREIMSRHTDAADEFLWASFAVGWGLVLHRSVFVANPRPLYPNLYCLLLSQSARGRKSTTLYALDLLLSALGTPYLPVKGLASIEGLYTQMKDHPRLPTLLAVDEFRALLAVSQRKVTENIIPRLQTLYDCPSSDAITKVETVTVEAPFLSIIAATPLSYAEETLAERHFTGGFLNRFIVLTGPRNPPLPRPPSLTAATLEPIIRSLRPLMQQLPSTSEELPLSPDAQRVWDKWYYAQDTRLDAAGDITEQLLNRLPNHVLKFCLLYATLDGQREITPAHLIPSFAIASYLEQLTPLMFSGVNLTHEGRTEQKVLECIRQGMKTAKEIKNSIGGRASMAEVNRALSSLVEGRIIVQQEQTTSKGRRYSVYFLAPQE